MGKQRGGGPAAKKKANPASLRSAAPSKGSGSRGHSFLPMEGGAPKGRRLDGESGMKKSGEDRLKYAVYESTLSTATRSPFPDGEGKKEAAPPQAKKANPASLRSAAPSKGRGSRGHALLPMEGGAPKGRRLDGESGMKESEEDRLKCAVYESTLSTATRSPFPDGEGYDTRIPLSTQSLPRVGKVASEASRIGQERYERERERLSQAGDIRKHPNTALHP